MKLRNQTTMLLSMGYDSLPAWLVLGRPQAIHYYLGTKYSDAELYHLLRLQERYPDARVYHTDALAWLGRQEMAGPTAFVPLRNMLLTTTTWGMGADDVVLAAATDYGPDKRLAFTLSLGLAGRVAMGAPSGRHLRGTRGRLRVRRPFRWYTKDRLLLAAYRATGTWDWLDLAYSCYAGTDPACGLCRPCRRVAVALAAAGAPAPAHLRLPRMSLRETLAYMPNALDFGTVPALAELLYLPLRSLMAYRAWRNTW